MWEKYVQTYGHRMSQIVIHEESQCCAQCSTLLVYFQYGIKWFQVGFVLP